MKLIKLQKGVHGKSAMALYKGKQVTMGVYLYNNIFGSYSWGDTKIVCHLEYNKDLSDQLDLPSHRDRIELSNYKDFISLRTNVSEIDKTEIID